MKIIVMAPEGTASSSHREQQEEVDVDINDTIADVKIKITMVYS